MKNQKLYFTLIAIGLFIIFCWSQCSGPKKTTITTPEINGSFKPAKPKHEVITSVDQFVEVNKKVSNKQTSKKTSKEDAFLQHQIDSLLQINAQMQIDFAEASQQVKDSLYRQAIALKYFSKQFEDEFIKLDINGIVGNGEVQMVMPEYTIKPQTIEIPKPKEVKFRMLVGVGAGINKDLNQVLLKAGIAFQNAKGKQLDADYVKINEQQFVVVGVKVPLFTIKK